MHRITVYFVGNSAQESLAGLVFDDPEIAEEFRSDNDYKAVYSFTATIDPESAEVVN